MAPFGGRSVHALMAAPYRINACTGIDQGDRPYQQDQLGLMAHRYIKGCVLGVIADGMGGLAGGRKAAEQVLLTAQQVFEQFDPRTDDGAAFLLRLAQEAHIGIRLTAATADLEPHSTLAAFLVLPSGHCHFAHSGDSRLYHFRGPQLLHRSQDHSLVQALVKQGLLSDEQARTDPRSNLLLHCLGTQQAPTIDSHRCEPLQVGDVLLACSDGIWQCFPDAELNALAHQATPRQACEELVAQARVRSFGSCDNLSLIVLKLDAAP
ncbi:MAG: serine/threonine-protein phosphatase [Pseudotabrizicola sp.]|uniref:PP2C family protein-serine/threonine phosphatase n=1 Tax=Pseudotabrizicola sp. TaxID=2939647 RepID=UPI0027236AE1|nr:PP2C family serine/threonine-protein phosphatase [Pseudotabrizicola sp.]MDO9638102.1 serine/threonine-protein phosphatase [Pseudotabrizicola sp.]